MQQSMSLKYEPSLELFQVAVMEADSGVRALMALEARAQGGWAEYTRENDRIFQVPEPPRIFFKKGWCVFPGGGGRAHGEGGPQTTGRRPHYRAKGGHLTKI